MPKIPSLPPMTSPDGADELPIEDVSASTTKYITLTKLKEWFQALVGWISTAMIADGAITLAKLLFSVSTYTQTGDGGGTGYYVNIGGIKMCWGVTGSITVGGAGNKTITMPVGFFTNVRAGVHDKSGSTVYSTQLGNPVSTTSMTVYFGSGTGTVNINWFVIGS